MHVLLPCFLLNVFLNIKGQVIYEMGNSKLASFCVQHAAFMNEGIKNAKAAHSTSSLLASESANRLQSAGSKRGGAPSQTRSDSRSTNASTVSPANQSVTQRAVVFAFLKNYAKAISVLEYDLKLKPSAEIFNLLGRTCMKAKKWNEAVSVFDESIELNVRKIGLARC